MATWQIFNAAKAAFPNGIHNLASNTLKIALTNTAPALTNSVLADITQIAGTGGYVPATMTGVSSAQAGGTYTLAFSNPITFTASGASFAPFRYLVLYNDTAASKNLIGFLDYGIAYTLPNGQSFTLTAGTVLTLA